MSKPGIYYPIPDKYKYSFAFDKVKIKPVVSEDKDKYLALASSTNLKKFLPKDLTEDNIGLLAWAGNFCVVNKINLNDDCVSTQDGIYLVDLLPYTYVDLEHNKGTILGAILNAGFSEYGTDKPLAREEIYDYKKPFNITVGGIIWRSVNQNFADAVEKMGNPDADVSINLSWEIAFSDYDLVLIDKNKTNLEEGRIISDASEIAKLEKKLKSYGGNGFTDEGLKVARLIKNEPIPLGAGFVEHPAGQVGEIVTASETMVCPECGKECDDDEMEDDAEKECPTCKKSNSGKKWKNGVDTENKEENKSNFSAIFNSQSGIDVVKADTNIQKTSKTLMTTIKDLTDEILKTSTASEIIKAHKIDLDAEIGKISQDFEAKKNKVETELKASSEKATQLEGELASAKDQLSKVQSDLDKLVQAAKAKEAEDIFSNRMNYFDAEFDLDEKSRNAVANRIKNLDESSYLKEKEDLEVLLAAKKKEKMPTDHTGKEDCSCAKCKAKAKASVSQASVDGQQAVDNAINNGEKTAVTVVATTTVTETNTQKFEKAFGKGAWKFTPTIVRGE